jgi:MinD-like ATPase involved in chromosome partitioning or flagellar assembly
VTKPVATAAGDIELEADIATSLASSPEIDLVLRCVDRSEFLGAVNGGLVAAVVLAGAPEWLDHTCVESCRKEGVNVVGVPSRTSDVIFFDRFQLSSSTGDPVELIDLIESPARESTGGAIPTQSVGSGQVIAVWGPKGAPGRTSVALELATAIETSGSSSILIDADPYGGDIAQLLGIIEEIPSIVWLCQVADKGELDRAAIASIVRRGFSSGPVIVPGLVRPDVWPEISASGFVSLVDECAAAFERVVIDVGFCLEGGSDTVSGGFLRNQVAISAVSRCDLLVAVMRSDPVGLKAFLWNLPEARAVSGRGPVVIVANRVQKNEEKELRGLLAEHVPGVPIVFIPNSDLFSKAADGGLPVSVLKPRSPVARAVAQLETVVDSVRLAAVRT